MRYIVKRKAPKWFLEYLKERRGIDYEHINSETKIHLRKNLVEEQFYLCGYCCGYIDVEMSHNEHIHPQSRYKNETVSYRNIIASCNGFSRSNENCGHKKGDRYEKKDFISPLEKTCADNFKYYINGEIVGLNEKAKATIGLLNLNSHDLMNARKKILMQSLKFDEKTARAIYCLPYQGERQPFCNIVEYFLEKNNLWREE